MAIELKSNLTPLQFQQATLYLSSNHTHQALIGCRPLRQTKGQVTNFINNLLQDDDFLMITKDTLNHDNNLPNHNDPDSNPNNLMLDEDDN